LKVKMKLKWMEVLESLPEVEGGVTGTMWVVMESEDGRMSWTSLLARRLDRGGLEIMTN
jgi:hypothetical protein